jgi:hypothetical protein
MHPSDWRNAPSRTKRLALAAMVGIVGGLILTTIFSGAAARAVGPTFVARNSAGETLLANSARLFLVAADEAKATALHVDALGLRGPVTSITTDGTDWFIGNDETGNLYRCDLVARNCVAALRAAGGRRIFRRAHRVAFANDRIFLTDSESHRLLVFDRQGQPLTATRTGPLALCFPNGIVAADDEIYVADTNNFRIARIAADDPARSATFLQVSLGAPLKRANCSSKSRVFGERGTPLLNKVIDTADTIALGAQPPASPDRVWPASVLRTSAGEWWVVQMDNDMSMGEVIRYHADGAPVGRVQLPPGADPIELIEARGEVLITDAGLTRVHRASLEGKLLGDWGPSEFQESLRGIVAERTLNGTLQHLSYTVMAAGMLAAFLVVVFEVRRQRQQGWAPRGTLHPVAIQSGEPGAETHWIPLDADFLRRTHRAGWLIVVYLLLLVAACGYLLGDLDLDTQLGRFRASMLGVMFGTVLAIAVAILINIPRLRQRRLGVNRREVRFESGSGKVIAAPWNDVRVGPRTLLLGAHLVQIIDARGRYLFPREAIETQLLGRLPRSAFLRNGRIVFESLRRGNIGMWATVLSFAFCLGLTLLRIFQPALVGSVTAAVFDWFR